MRKYGSVLLAFSLLLVAPLPGQDTKYPPQGEQIPGPENPAATSGHCCATGSERPLADSAIKAWLADVRHWRTERLVRIGFNEAQYDRPVFQWVQKAFIQPQMMAQDRYFYDPHTGKYTVARYLEDLKTRYGGIDAVLIWPTYPNLGIDDRNQFDLIRDMPGGIAGLREMVQSFHRHGVRVLFPYNPWDQGTRPEGAPDWETLAKLMAEMELMATQWGQFLALSGSRRTSRDIQLFLNPRAGTVTPMTRPWHGITSAGDTGSIRSSP